MADARGWLAAFAFVAFVVGAVPAAATPGSTPQLVIGSATADFTAGTLTIGGANFGDSQPAVTLNGVPLVVASSSPTEIVADLPEHVGPGSYLLTVSRGPATTQFDTFSVTLGAVGPTGPTGPVGPPGPAGTFAGHFQSPNGAYSLDVTDTGIQLAGPGTSIQIANGTITILATNVSITTGRAIDVQAGTRTTIHSGTTTDIQSGGSTTIKSDSTMRIQSAATIDIRGTTVTVNGSPIP
jgi:hypothetical protein